MSEKNDNYNGLNYQQTYLLNIATKNYWKRKRYIKIYFDIYYI